MRKGGSFLLEPVVVPVFTREMFTDEQREIEQTVKQFAKEKILSNNEMLSELNKDLTLEMMREAGALGLTAIDIPEQYGGLALDKTTSALVVEALTTGQCASFAVTFSVHVCIGTLPIVFFGSEAQKEKYLPKLATAEWLGAYALTEPEAGSDALNIKTSAYLAEDGKAYVLNGTKQYVSNGGWADIFITFAKIDEKDFTAFILDRDSEGLSTGPEEKKMGIKGSSTTNLVLENVRVPKENLLGKPGEGHHIALNILNIGRFKLGAADLGGCKACVTLATQYALDRIQFGQPIAFFESVRKKLADMLVQTYTLDSVIYRTVGLMDKRIASLDIQVPDFNMQIMNALEEYAIEASLAKIMGSETLFHVSDHGIQIYGGYGFSEDYPMARVFRDNRIDRIFEGTNEINRMVAYGYYLKKALMEELPLRDAERSWKREAPTKAHPLQWEIHVLDVARRITLKCLYEAISLYGQNLRDEQIIGEDIADLILGYYGASSTLNRILQQGDRTLKDRAFIALARLAVVGYLEEVWRIAFRLKPVLFSSKYGQNLMTDLEKNLQKLHPPFDPVKEVHILTDDLFHYRHYRF
jgi:alkylation response protein AidB-like acyl-CoA dehydrogenase